ncbi:RsmB/NOP family class I SAM-dependent RNA methyltransferase [Sphingobium sp. CR28]|uniref:RsmB/NOP family class I SAM-dependent RNA methyltransferase n=1 Tax=Sphingobium sp. CR28 TaxID=3400272 RepID=UPI003FF0E94E
MPQRQPTTAAQPAGLAARRAALRLLDAILRRGEALEAALAHAAAGLEDRADRALVHAIVSATLRHMTDIDALIDSATRQRLASDAKARMVLRLSLAQALVLGTPGHAVVATALPLVDGGPRRLVHGVLGTLLRKGGALPDPPNLPKDVAGRWKGAWGGQVLAAARSLLSARAPTDLTLRASEDTAAWAERLSGTSLLPGHVRLSDAPDIAGLEGFSNGSWWVQDIAASLPGRLLGAGAGRHALDLCAAPGGKTMQLAAAGWQVTALDASERRLERLQENLTRTGLTAEVVTADVLQWAPEAPVDAILLDAPCSATGIFRRHPDVLYRAGPRHIAEMAELQAALLDRAAGWLRPGGRLVYATCSLEPDEGERQIERFLAAHPEMQAVAIDPTALPNSVKECAPGQLRLLPGMLSDAGGLDGFFIAHLSRSESD